MPTMDGGLRHRHGFLPGIGRGQFGQRDWPACAGAIYPAM